MYALLRCDNYTQFILQDSGVSTNATFALQLIITLEAEIKFTAGFQASFPEDAWVIVDPDTGLIVRKSGL